MPRKNIYDSSELCRYYLAALLARGFDLKAIAKGLSFGRRELKRIWMATGYTPLASDATSELGRFIEAHPGLPGHKDLLEEGLGLEERMGAEVWNDPPARDAWLAENAA